MDFPRNAVTPVAKPGSLSVHGRSLQSTDGLPFIHFPKISFSPSVNEWKVPWYPTSSPLTGQEKKTMEYPSKDRDYGNEMQLMGLLKNSGISWLVNKRNTIKNMKTSSKEESLDFPARNNEDNESCKTWYMHVLWP